MSLGRQHFAKLLGIFGMYMEICYLFLTQDSFHFCFAKKYMGYCASQDFGPKGFISQK
jgi:hypothetical protein